MNRTHRKSGFSLIELLTVIAIIAILAAVIFPVMTAVKNNAKKTQCITNLHSIQSALKMYKLDNRKYPEHLGPILSGPPLTGAVSGGTPFENVKDQDCLYPQYIRTPQGYKCPNVPTTNTTDSMEVKIATLPDEVWMMYVYDSYDATCTSAGVGELRYALVWAPQQADVDTFESQSGGNTAQEQADDYARQLRWKNPPEDTVVTWCDYHLRSGPNCLVLFLDGHVDQIPGDKMAACKWRIRAKA